MPKFTVIHPVEHDGVRKEEGETIELSAKAAQPLLDIGHIEAFDKKAAAKAEAEAAAKEKWNADVTLREQFGNDFDVYMAEALEPHH